MAEFGSAVITDAGAALLASVMSGSKQMEFTALTVGDGTYSEDDKEVSALQAMTALKNQRLSFAFSSVAPYSETAVCLKAVVTNLTVTSGFYINEVGIWAKDASDNDADPILYSIVAANTADYLPAYNGTTPSTIEQDWYTTLSNTATASITVSSSAYATASDFEEFKENIANVEASAEASRAYEAGDFLIYVNKFYKVITDIEEGDTLEVNTNIEATTVAAVISEIKSGSIVRMTFDADFAGATFTLTDGSETYTGTVPSESPYVVEQTVLNLETAFTVSAAANGTTYESTVSIGQYYGLYTTTLEAFRATLTVSADISGASVADTNVITATDGTNTYTAEASASGDYDLTIYHPGTYTVSMTNGTDTSGTVSVVISTNGGIYATTTSYFEATLTVTVVNGTGATITATDGTHTYTAEESSGTATLSIYATGTYTVSAELSGETGALTASVTVDTDGGSYTANVGFASTTLNDNDWDVISAVSAAGLGDTLWDVGDCKAVEVSGTVGTLSVSDTYYAFIIGFNHNSAVEGEGITFQGFKTAATGGTDIALCDSYYGQYQKYDGTKYFQMNHWGTSSNYNTNYGGWPACDMRYDILGSTDQAPSGYGAQKATGATGTDPSDTCATSPKANTLMAALPAALRAVMKPITKVTDGVGNSSDAEANLRTTKDYLPLLAEFEIFGARTYANQYEQNHQKQYDYYKNGNPKIKYNHSATTTAVGWWERSAYYNHATYFCYVNANGSANYTDASRSNGLAPAFLI